MSQISVIMPTYNAEKYLKEAVDSILSQTFADFELLVIDDGSSDKTIDILNSFNDQRIRIIQGDKKGIADALNKGIENSNGEYIARMDAGDGCFATRFEKQSILLDESPDIGMCCSNVDFINLSEWSFWGKDIHSPRDFDSALLFFNPIIHPAVMFRKDVFGKFGFRYNTDYKSSEDYELWCRLIGKVKIASTNENLLHYRIHSSNTTNMFADKGKSTYLSVIKQNLKNFLNMNAYGIYLESFWFDMKPNAFSEIDIFKIMLFYKKIQEQIEFKKEFDIKIVNKFLSSQLDDILDLNILSLNWFKLRFIFHRKCLLKNFSFDIDIFKILKYIIRHPFFIFKLKEREKVFLLLLKYLLIKGI